VGATAFAGTFTDVPASAYYYTAVEKLADDGVLSKSTSSFSPSSLFQRDQAAKLVVLGAAITPLENPASPTFTDVPKTAWSYQYVETAAAHQIISGYAAKPGYYGPGDPVTREQYAKMLVEAYGWDLLDPATPHFTDVPKTSWSYKYVETAYHWSVINGMTATTFAPTANIIRGDAALMSYRAKYEAAERTDDTVVEGGAFEIKLSSDTPAEQTLPSGATAASVFALDLTAGDNDVIFNGLTVHKTGVGAIPTTMQAYLYDGNDRLTSGKGMNSSTNTFVFSNVGLQVDAGETKTVMMKVDAGTIATAGEVYFEVASADVVTTTADEVTGDFPITSEKVGLSTTTAGTITIAKNGSVNNPKVGELSATVAKFTLNASTEAAEVEQLGLYVTGTISAADATNLKLYVTGETDPLAETAGVNSKDLAVFTFDTPYEIEKGGTKSFYVTADMEPGRNGDTLAIYIDESTDVVAIGATYGYGMSVTKTNYMSTTCTATSSTTCSFSTLEGGDITIVSSGPSATDIATNAKDIHLMDFTVTSVNDVTFKNFPVGLIASEAEATEGLVNSTAANFTDVKIINTETGETLMGPIDSTSFKLTSVAGTTIDETTTGDAAQSYYLFTDEFSMDAGETLKLALTSDVANTATLANMTLISSIQTDATYPQVKDVNNKTLTNSSSLVPSSAITGKTMTVKSPSLTLSLASTPASKTYVKGFKDIKFTGITFTCGTASACKITDITLATHLDSDVDGYDDGGTDGYDNSVYASTYVGSVSLKDVAGTVVAASKSVTSTGAVSFTNLSWNLAAGESKTVYVTGDLSTNAVTNGLISFAIDATTDVTVEDTDGNAISSVTGTPNSAQTVVVTVSAGGTLTASVDSATPKENILLAGSADQALTKFKFAATDEAFVIKKLAIQNRQQGVATANLGDNDDNVTSVKISYTNSAGSTETKTGTLTNGNVEFSGMDLEVEADGDATMTVYATLNTISGGADAGTFVDFNLALENFEAVAQGSGDTYSAAKLDPATLSVGTITFTSTVGPKTIAAAANTVTLNTSETVTVPDLDVALPVGTLVKFGAASTTWTKATEVTIALTTAYADGGTSLVGLVVNDADGQIDTGGAENVYYALPGTGYLTASNQMQVYETKPTVAVNSGSPSGSRSVATSDNAFIFDVTAGSAEKVQIRTGKALTTCALGFDAGNTGDSTVAPTSTTAAIDGSDCLLTQGTAAAEDSISFDAGAVSTINQYARVSFWMRPSAITPEFADIQYGTDAAAGAGATGTVDNLTALAASDCTFQGTATSANMTASTWYHCDVAVNSATTTERYFHIGFVDVTEFANGTTLTVDQVVLYNDKITMDLTGDDIDTYANMQASAANGTVVAYLKEGSDTLATGYVYKNTSAAAEGGSASVTFVPIDGTDAAIEVSKNTTRTFTVQLSTTALLAEDAGADDPLTFAMDMGTSASGTVTAGDFWWNDTNFGNATIGSAPGTSYALTTPGIVKWLGQVTNTTLNSNTVKY